jgi:glycine/serine hydroxymethyltransferase
MDFEKKSKDWNNRLLKMIQPKIIICEGKSAYTKVLQHDNLTENWDGDVAYTNWNGTHVVGYKRLFSNIKGKERLSEVLKGIIINK